MALFDLFKKDSCGVCSEEYSLTNLHSCKDGYICKSCSYHIGLGSEFDEKFTCEELANIIVSPEQIIKYRIASHIATPDIALNADETCYFVSMGEIGKEKSRTVTVKKGNKTEKKTENYWNKYLCRLFVTDQRIIALADTNGFEIKLAKLMDIKFESDRVIFFAGAKTYTVFMVAKQIEKIKDLWSLLRDAGEYEIAVDKFSLEDEIDITKDIEAFKYSKK